MSDGKLDDFSALKRAIEERLPDLTPMEVAYYRWLVANHDDVVSRTEHEMRSLLRHATGAGG